jgi:hypothetical protein
LISSWASGVSPAAVSLSGIVVRDQMGARHGLGLVGHRVLDRVVAAGDLLRHSAVEQRPADDQGGDHHRRDQVGRVAGQDHRHAEDHDEGGDEGDLPLGHIRRIPGPCILVPDAVYAMICVKAT